MPTVDRDHRDLRLEIAVFGGAAEVFLGGLHLTDGELTLAEVYGWRPRLFFEAFPVDPWSGDAVAGKRVEELVPYLDALVLTDALTEGSHYSSTAVERLGRVLRPLKIGIPTAIFGLPALAQEWESLSGVKPIIVVDPNRDNAVPIVKALSKILLRSQMKSTPPPPPVT